jgi:hypothetical protein
MRNTNKLPAGFTIEQDDDGDWFLIPPSNVTIFSVPGEPWMITNDFMRSRDWNSQGDLVAASCEYLGCAAIRAGGQPRAILDGRPSRIAKKSHEKTKSGDNQ